MDRVRLLRPRTLSLLAALFGLAPGSVLADCSLVSTGNIPLPDLGGANYQGFQGGLYPNGSDTAPAAHYTAGVAQAAQIAPLNSAGIPDEVQGQIGLISIGLSNTTFEFSDGPESFKPRADADPSKNPKVTIVDGAQGGRDAVDWADPQGEAWSTLSQRLADAGLSAAQVEVVWMKLALDTPQGYGSFPVHAQVLQTNLETVIRLVKSRYPSVRIIYLSSRTRAYTEDPNTVNPEPFAYESGFAVQWTIADQINGLNNLNFDVSKGPVVAPYLRWGPYLWADGTTPRSDGFTWLCKDLQGDFTHPASGGVAKVADQLLDFCKTDPMATSWFLKPNLVSPPVVTASANPGTGQAGLVTQFSTSVIDPGSGIAYYSWTFDDGTFSDEQNPAKTFPVPGSYSAHLTVTTVTGGYATATVPVLVQGSSGELLNVSARLQIGVDDNVAIGGFIVGGSGTNRVMLRAIGPSLAQEGVSGPLSDPFLELHDATGATIASNDNWQTTQLGGLITEDQVAAIRASTIAPTNPAEAALIADLAPGSYTAIGRGAHGETGIGLAEIYNLDRSSPAVVSNLSTRGFVETASNVMIGGFIVGGSQASTIVTRALGPSLAQSGVSGVLADPTLELHDENGALIAFNDDWADEEEATLKVSGLAPVDSHEAAIESTLAPGLYTAVMAGKDGGIGIGLVEIYKLP
ncbi:MAG: PKD domain-containing protein [Chthoniobacterales bacterium]